MGSRIIARLLSMKDAILVTPGIIVLTSVRIIAVVPVELLFVVLPNLIREGLLAMGARPTTVATQMIASSFVKATCVDDLREVNTRRVFTS